MDPLGDGISRLEVVDHMGSDQRIVQAARVSYGKEDKEPDPERDAKLIRYMLKNGHWSPFEHCMVTFLVQCPLFIRSQWHRHRSWAYNEISRRYTSDDISFYVPKEWRQQDEKNKQVSVGAEKLHHGYWSQATRGYNSDAFFLYMDMLDAGVAREQARMVLPQTLYTRFYATASLRSIIHFYQQRADSHAQWEMQKYGEGVGQLTQELFPVAWEAFVDSQ